MAGVPGLVVPLSLVDNDVAVEDFFQDSRTAISLLNAEVGKDLKPAFTTTEAVIVNSAAEADLFSYTIPGGSLGADGVVYFVDMLTQVKNTSGSSRQSTLRVKYGATTMVSLATADISNGTDAIIRMRAWLWPDTSAASQLAYAAYITTAGIYFDDKGAAVENSTGDLDFKVTYQFSAALTTLEARMRWLILRKYQV